MSKEVIAVITIPKVESNTIRPWTDPRIFRRMLGIRLTSMRMLFVKKAARSS